MRSVCFFSSYFNETEVPYYIEFYLENLLPHFSEIVFITNEKHLNEKSVSFLKERNITLKFVQNEGWDFGMWYKAFKETDITSYDRVALINDSCVLFIKPDKFFNWLNSTELDYAGMVDSNAISYHIQSFFVIINRRGIEHVADYFNSLGLISDVKNVILKYEVGLSQYLIKKGLKVGAFCTTKEYVGEYSPMFYMAETIINNGVPLIKKKIVFNSFRNDEYLNLMRMKFQIDPNHYIQIIKKKYKNDPELIDFNKVYGDYGSLNHFKLIKFKVFSFLFQIARQFKFLKRA